MIPVWKEEVTLLLTRVDPYHLYSAFHFLPSSLGSFKYELFKSFIQSFSKHFWDTLHSLLLSLEVKRWKDKPCWMDIAIQCEKTVPFPVHLLPLHSIRCPCNTAKLFHPESQGWDSPLWTPVSTLQLLFHDTMFLCFSQLRLHLLGGFITFYLPFNPKVQSLASFLLSCTEPLGISFMPSAWHSCQLQTHIFNRHQNRDL